MSFYKFIDFINNALIKIKYVGIGPLVSIFVEFSLFKIKKKIKNLNQP